MSSENFKILPLVPEESAKLCRFMVANTERFLRYLPQTLAQNQTPGDSKIYIQRKQKEHQERKEFTFALRNSLNGDIIGLIIIKDLCWTSNQGELAYCIDNRWEGKGIMTQAVKEIIAKAFTELGLEILHIIVYHGNRASVKVAEKTGFKWKKTLYCEHTPPNEPPMDMELYELNKNTRT